MVVPNYQKIMLPLLKLAGDGKNHVMRDAFEQLADVFGLDDSDRRELLPSGRQTVWQNRAGWARTYLKKAGLVEYKKMGTFTITQLGMDVLSKNPSDINNEFLMQFPGFVEFKTKTNKESEPESEDHDENTQEEIFENSYQNLRDNVAQELLESIKSCSSEFFERLVIDLLLNIGYGGSRRDAGEAIGRSGDGGIDGIIKEDKLGLDTIYIQAKRWENIVSRPEIQKFAGALQGQQAKKGVFITTSNFSNGAIEYADIIDSKVVLIDGERLAQLMIDYDIGVSKIKSYELKKIDTDYFTEE